MGHERIAAIERNVQPLVAVGGPGVGLLRSSEQVPVCGARGGPQPERAIDVHPSSVPFGDGDQRGEILVHAGVDVAGLEMHDRGRLRIVAQCALERLRREAALIVGRQRLAAEILVAALQGGGIRLLIKRFEEKQLIFGGSILLAVSLLAWGLTPNLWLLLIVLVPLSLASGTLRVSTNSAAFGKKKSV